MTSDENTIEGIARMLARAYWRGRHDEAHGTHNVTGERLEELKRVAENDLERWKAMVRASVEEGGIVVEVEPAA